MAAATVASTSRPRVLGDIKRYYIALTALANTNTFTAPGTAATRVLGVFPVSVSTSASVTFTWSGQTITANVSTGTPDVIAAVEVG